MYIDLKLQKTDTMEKKKSLFYLGPGHVKSGPFYFNPVIYK